MIGMSQVQAQRQNNQQRIIAPWRPLGWTVEPWRDRFPVILLTGGAGGGKSRLAGEKVHGFCLKYRGATGLVLRKAKTTMSSGTSLFLSRKVIGIDPSVRWIDSPKFRFEYRNTSILQLFGLHDEDSRQSLKSIGQDGAVDIAWMEEATQFDEEDYNAVIARMRGKAAPWTQIILTCNPDAPTHWIKRRLIDGGEAHVYYSFAGDNPYNPDEYATETLGRLTGIDALRLAGGQWIQATGAVYGEVWSDGPTDGNVTESAVYEPDAGPVFWGIDDGYSAGSAQSTRGIDPKTGHYVADSHPRVILFCQLRPTGQLIVFCELYACLRLSNEQIDDALALPYPKPQIAAHGPGSAEIRGRLQQAQIVPNYADCQVEDGIKALRGALAKDANGIRGLLVNPSCKHLRAEMASYRYGDDQRPVKAFDHSPDALKYLNWIIRKRYGR